MREITCKEVHKLLECIKALSAYHNEVSNNFKGMYPSRPYSETLTLFSDSLRKGSSHIAIVEEKDHIAGFCKIDMVKGKGKLDYLVVLEKYRGKGYGKELMDWAMNTFHKNDVTEIEVKVIDGNNTIHLYENYGFKIQSHILLYKASFK